MDVMSGRSSASSAGLNPNAPMFVPWAYRTVEDFSDQWWELVKSSPWFRDYWLQECFQGQEEQEEEEEDVFDEYDPFLSDADELFHGYRPPQEEGKGGMRDMVKWGAERLRGRRGTAEVPRYGAKAAKIVSVKVSPRPIQQPR